jgi:hypothetical protein
LGSFAAWVVLLCSSAQAVALHDHCHSGIATPAGPNQIVFADVFFVSVNMAAHDGLVISAKATDQRPGRSALYRG